MTDVLAVVPKLLSGIASFLNLRINIPLLTDLIELVVFQKKQVLSLKSLFTLAAAALFEVIGALAGTGLGGAMSFDNSEPNKPVMVVPVEMGAMANGVGITIDLFVSLVAALFAGFMGKEEELKVAGAVFAGLNVATSFITVPFAVSQTSFLLIEQFYCWTANLVAAALQFFDALSQALGKATNPKLTVPAGLLGASMLAMSVYYDQAALSQNKGDAELTKLDLATQIMASINNLLSFLNLVMDVPSKTGLAITSVNNLATFGTSVGFIMRAVHNPNALLG
jgi:hypothetical protein